MNVAEYCDTRTGRRAFIPYEDGKFAQRVTEFFEKAYGRTAGLSLFWTLQDSGERAD